MLNGPGRLGLRRSAVARASDELTGWHATWVRHLPRLTVTNGRLAQLAAGPDDRPALEAALEAAARRESERAHPEYAELCAAADAAGRAHYAAQDEVTRARYHHDNRFGPPDQADYSRHLADAEKALAATHQELTDIRARIATLRAEPALLAQPPERVRQESDTWRTRRDAAQHAARNKSRPAAEPERAVHRPRPEDLRHLQHRPGPGRGIGR